MRLTLPALPTAAASAGAAAAPGMADGQPSGIQPAVSDVPSPEGPKEAHHMVAFALANGADSARAATALPAEFDARLVSIDEIGALPVS